MSPFNFLVRVNTGSVPLPTPITIDAGDDDDEFLKRMRTRFKSANPGEHSNHEAAFKNVAAGGRVDGTIIGHGSIGRVNTGQGGDLNNAFPSKFIAMDNADDWTAAIKRLRGHQLDRIHIFACYTGAGKEGGILLSALADALGCTVLAPNGPVSAAPETNDPQFAVETRWRTVHPGIEPDPLGPARFTPVQDSPPPALRLTRGDGFVEVPLEAVRQLRGHFARERSQRDAWSLSWSGELARRGLTFVNLGSPLQFPSLLPTLVTGHLELTVEVDGKEVTWQFRVQSDHLIDSADAPGIYYEIDLAGLLQWGTALR